MKIKAGDYIKLRHWRESYLVVYCDREMIKMRRNEDTTNFILYNVSELNWTIDTKRRNMVKLSELLTIDEN